MKRIYPLLFLLSVLAGCQKNNDLQKDSGGILNVENKSYLIGASGGYIDIQVETNIQYVVSIPSDGMEWISATSAGTPGNEILRLVIRQNTNMDARSSVIRLAGKSGSPYAEIAVTQKGYVPRNQIFYTSNDGGKVIPGNTLNTFGPGFTITSNTYFDGKGVITFDGDITTVGNKAFCRCTNLKSIILPDGISSVGDSAFEGCTALLDISLPGELLTIGKYAFHECSSLTNLLIPSSVAEIGIYAFNSCEALTEITVPSGVPMIEQGVFSECTALRTVFLPNQISTIGNNAFSGCTSLTNISLPDQLVTIGENAFSNCTSLADVSIPASVTEIGNGAFTNCTAFTVLSIPSSVEKVGDYVASGCTCDFYVYPPKNATSDPLRGGGSNPVQGFRGYVIVPDDASFIPEGFGCDYNAKGYKGKYASEDNHCLIYNETLIDYTRGEGGSSYLTPKGIKRIGRYAFSGAYMQRVLSNLRISEGVEEIASEAFGFHYNDFEVIELPASLKTISSYAFADCAHIQYICCQAKTPPVMDNYFKFTTNRLKTIFVPEESVELYKEAMGWKTYGNRLYGVNWKDEDYSPVFSDDMWPY